MKKLLLVIALIGGGGAYYYYQQQNTTASGPRARPTANVVVTNASMQQVRDEVQALGTTRANESLTLLPKVTELVTRINFKDGQMVQKGDVLVKLQDTEQRAKVQVAEVNLKESERELARISTLVSNKTVAALERDKLLSEIDAGRAELQLAQSALTDRTIVAPFSGLLGLRQISPGALVTPSTAITTLDDISVIKLDFAVPERFLPGLKVGKSVEAEAVAYSGKVFAGKVISIDSRVNPDTRAVMVRAEIPNPDAKLLPGMLMTIRLIKTSRETLMIPEAALVPMQNRQYVYLVDADNKVQRREVTLGLRKRGWVEIRDGLTEQDAVMVHGMLKVRPGDTVKPELKENFTAAVATQGGSAS